jgi:uncharacterized protein (DUF885 family)
MKFWKFCLLVFSAIPFAAAGGDEGARLHSLFDREWKTRLSDDPLYATSVGVHDYDALLPSLTKGDLSRRAEAARGYLAELASIDRSQLDSLDRVSAEIFERQLRDRLDAWKFHEEDIPLTADWGFHSDLVRLPDTMTFLSVQDYENYISRLKAIPVYMDQQIALMREGLANGMTLPKVVLKGIDETMTAHVVKDAEKSVWWKPFSEFPAAFSQEDRQRLSKAGRDAISGSAVPSFQKLAAFMVNDYIPHARTTIAATSLPDGKALYAFQIRRFTTLDLAPEEIHRTGLAEVDRIQKEMNDVIRQTGFSGDFRAFLDFLRTDPRFYARTPEELLRDASFIAKKMDGKLPSLFKTLPRLPYGVQAVPADIAPKFTGGRYVESPVGSTQPGWFWVNTYQLDHRPLYTLESLTLHEAVPGHHLQIALTQEQKGLPNFRRYSYISAFGEGWGLYCEHLGLEAGFYTDPYSNFGRLTYEMWRACRLVVDTGIHAMGWTRQQAIDYMASHTALSLHECETETDRYIAWPGQALSYKLGEMKIRELRRRAEEALSQKFDVREFHDAVLLNGSVTLPVLEKAIDRYIAEVKAR